ncbi:MAG TPA: hypothetical protein VGH14_16715 [Solirubrobacterales bacterium]
MRDPQSFALHMEFIAQAGRDPELARRFGIRSAALRATAKRQASRSRSARTTSP